MTFIKSLPYDERFSGNYDRALAALQANKRVRIGHIDTGLTEHPALGFSGSAAPDNIHLGDGINLIEPGTAPIVQPTTPADRYDACRDAGGSIDECLAFYPEHGTKTLSVILSDNDRMRGVAPGAQIVPCRIADGPIPISGTIRDNMGQALTHLLDLPGDSRPQVVSISMGSLLNFPREPFIRAKREGVIVVCAAGQVVDRVVTPARYGETIGVGGFRAGGKHLRRHYPNDPYDIPHPPAVHVWALADSINRAASYKNAAGQIEHIYAEDETGASVDDVSGTSYATPQVASAAALWVETHWDALPAPGAPGSDKVVDAFVTALTASADKDVLHFPFGGSDTFPCLNINRLMTRAPSI